MSYVHNQIKHFKVLCDSFMFQILEHHHISHNTMELHLPRRPSHWRFQKKTCVNVSFSKFRRLVYSKLKYILNKETL